MVKLKPAYSLIELTVIVGLTGLLAITITAISLSSLLSARRLRLASQIHHLGNHIINQLSYLIRNSIYIVSCNSANNTLTFTNQDSLTTTISFNNSTSQIASQSAINSYYLNPSQFPASNFSLSCLPNDNQPNLIQISFTLSNQTTAQDPYSKVSLNFSTSIAPRNQ